MRKIPDLSDKGFKFRKFIFEEGKNVKGLGVTFSKENFEFESDAFTYFIEIFNKENPIENANLDGEKIDGYRVFYNYTPKFQPIKNLIQENSERITWRGGNEVHSIILNADQASEKLTKYFKMLRGEEGHKEELELFNFIKYFPKEVEDWKLRCLFMWFSKVERGEDQIHWISNLHGNYKLKDKEKYLNVEYRFGCESPEIKEDLKRIPDSSSLEGEKEVKFGGKKFSLKTIKNFKNQPKVKAYFWFNEENNCTLIVHNNRTTDFEDYEGDMKELLKAGLDSLEDYSLLERMTERDLSGSLFGKPFE